MKKTLYVLAAALGLATVLACSGTGPTATSDGVSGSGTPAVGAPSPAAPKVFKVGETVKFDEEFLGERSTYEITITKATRAAKEPGTYGDKPKKGEYLVLDVAVKVGAGDVQFILSSDFKFIGADGTVYDSGYEMGFGDVLNASELRAGQKASGKIVFDIPKGAWNTGRVQYAASFLSDDATCLWALA